MKEHLAMLQRRYARLCRYVAYGEDGHGNELSDQAYVMVCLAIQATAMEIARIDPAEVGK